MATTQPLGVNQPAAVPNLQLDAWLARLNELMDRLSAWAKEFDWPVRRIDKRMTDGEFGRYTAPALILQRDADRVMAEPIARSAPGADGVVDFYLMPGYDDVATLFYYAGEWHVHYPFGRPGIVAHVQAGQAKPLTRESFREVIEGMTADGR